MASVTTDDGVRLYYAEYGNPGGMPVVLIAGVKAAATSWRPQIRALVRARYRVLALDRRGHGLSDRPPPAPRCSGTGRTSRASSTRST